MYMYSTKTQYLLFDVHAMRRSRRYQSGNGKMAPHSDSDNKSDCTVTC